MTVFDAEAPRRAAGLTQARFLLQVSLKHFLRRPVYLVAVILAFTLIAMVSIMTFSVHHGLAQVTADSQEPGMFFMMRSQSDSELASIITPVQVHYLSQLPQMAAGESGKASYSPELTMLVRQQIADKKIDFILRGVTPQAFLMRNLVSQQPYIRLVKGRAFTPGKREAIVGAALARRYPQLAAGKQIKVKGAVWTITGEFVSGGSMRESELWTDREILRTDYGLGNVYSVVAFSAAANVRSDTLNQQLQQIEKGTLTVTDAARHYAGQSSGLLGIIAMFGVVFGIMGGLMVFAGVAVLAESLLVNQAVEFRTIRLMGFGRILFAAFALPFLACSLVGSALGALICQLAGQQMTFSTLAGPAEVVFSAVQTPTIALLAAGYCILIALAACAVNYSRVLNILTSR